MTTEMILTFEDARPTLMGLAYRILGSVADASDAVQDTFVAWQRADRAAIPNARAWLITVCTHRCLDVAKAASRTRVSYVGAWLPEPVHTLTEETPEEHAALSSSLTTAFLLLLERLTPKERAAYLLHEVFDRSYEEVAAMLGTSEAACRQLVSRARRNVGEPAARHRTPRDRQRELLDAFRHAVAGGSSDALARLLATDVELSADGGGKVPAVRETLQGAEVLAFIADRLREYWHGRTLIDLEVNGALGLALREGDRITGVVSFDYDEQGRARRVFIIRNPDKLARLHGGAPVLS